MKIRLSTPLLKSLRACFTTARTFATLTLLAGAVTVSLLPATAQAVDLVIGEKELKELDADLTVDSLTSAGTIDGADLYDITINNVTDSGGDIIGDVLTAVSGSSFSQLTVSELALTGTEDTTTIGGTSTIGLLSGVGGITIADESETTIIDFGTDSRDVVIGEDATLTLGADDIATGIATLDSLTSEGTLSAADYSVVINAATSKGGNINAANLTVQTDSSFGTLTLDTLVIAGTAEGSDDVVVRNGSDIGEVSGEGAFTIASGTSSAPSEVTVGKMTLAGVADEIAVNIGDYATLNLGNESDVGIVAGDGTLNIADDATVDVYSFLLESSDAVTLTIGDDATLNIENDSTIETLDNEGFIDAGTNSLTIRKATEDGGSLIAGTLSIEGSNRFDALEISRLTITGDLSTDDYSLVLQGFKYLGNKTIVLSLEELEDDGSKLSAGDYLLIDQQKGGENFDTITWNNFVLTDESTDAIYDLIMTGHDVFYAESDGNIQLDVKVATGRTWNTSENFAASEKIETGDLNYIAPILGTDGQLISYDILDAVNNINVDQDTTIDLTNRKDLTPDYKQLAPVDDEDTVMLNNVRGDEGVTLTLLGDGIDEDSATFNNDKVSVFKGDVIANNLTINAQHSSNARLELSSLKLQNAHLNVASGDVFYVDTLTSDEDSKLSGTVYITGTGSDYIGDYDDATIVTVLEGASINAIASHELTVGGTAGEITLTNVYGNEIKEISTSGANIILHQDDQDNLSTSTTTLSEDSSVSKDGKVTVTVDGQAMADSIAADKSHMTIFTGGEIEFTSGGTLVIADIDSSREISMDEGVAAKDLTLLTVSDVAGSDGEDGLVEFEGIELEKTFTNARFETEGDNLIVVADQNINFYNDHAVGTIGNNVSGMQLVNELYYSVNPQGSGSADSDIVKVLNELDDYITAGNAAAANQFAAAIAGSSTTALGSALKGDMDRQLRVMRDRASTFSRAAYVGETKKGAGNFWIEGMVNDSELDATDYSAGHTLSGFGGSVGYDKQVSDTFSFGGAISAVYGDLTATAADAGEGELNTYYVNLYAHINRGRWTNSFAAIVGIADTTLTRTLPTSTGDVTTEGSSSGMTYGLTYELGYLIPLNRSSSSVLQPILNFTYQSTSIDGYTETGDAGLEVGSQDLSYASFGVGMRYETTIGGKIFDRHATFSLRGLAKFDSGDSNSETEVSLLANPGQSATVVGAEAGNTAYEFGVGLYIPVSPRASIYVDAAAETRDLQTQMNAAVGYQISF